MYPEIYGTSNLISEKSSSRLAFLFSADKEFLFRAHPKSVITYCNFYNIQCAKPERMPGYLELL
jgi:hypothetical protein